jgi:hypothetical protein
MLRNELVVVLMMFDAIYRSILGGTQRNAVRESVSRIEINSYQDRKLIWTEKDYNVVVVVDARVK